MVSRFTNGGPVRRKEPKKSDGSRPLKLDREWRDCLRSRKHTCPRCEARLAGAEATRISFRIHDSRPAEGIGHVDVGFGLRCKPCGHSFDLWLPFRPGISWGQVLGYFINDDQPDPAEKRRARKPPAKRRRRTVRPSVPDERRRLGPISDVERDRLLAALRKCRTPTSFLKALGIGRSPGSAG